MSVCSIHGWSSAPACTGPVTVTDAYLLVLASTHEGRFVTFDRSLSLAAAPGANEENLTVL